MVKLLYFLCYLIASSLSFLTIVILTGDLKKTQGLVNSNIFLYLIIQVAGGLLNVVIGFSALRTKFEDYINIKSFAFLMPFTFAASLISPIFGGLCLGFFGALVSYIIIFSGKGHLAALLNLINSLFIFGTSLISLYSDREFAPYILLMGSFASIMIGFIYILKEKLVRNKKRTLQLSLSNIEIYNIILLSIIFGLTNIYIPILFLGVEYLGNYIIYDKVIGALSIAFNSHYMNGSFMNKKNIIFSFIEWSKFLFVTLTLGLIALVSIEKLAIIFDYSFSFFNSFKDVIIIVLLSMTWSLNLYCGRYLRYIQSGLPIKIVKIKLLCYQLFSIILILFVYKFLIDVKIDNMNINLFLMGFIYLSYWAIILRVLWSAIDENSLVDKQL